MCTLNSSEYRLLLRQDNADARLTPIGHKLGLIDNNQYKLFEDKQEKIPSEIKRLSETKLPADEKINEILAKYEENIERGMKLIDLLKRPNIDYLILKELDEKTKELDLAKDVYEQVEILVKYDGYIKRQQIQVEQSTKLEKFRIPDDINYSEIEHISTETREKLTKIRPQTLGQATRIGGVKPADISVLMVMLEKGMLRNN